MKKVVILAIAIVLAIAITATGVFASSKASESGKVVAGKVDGEVDSKVDATDSEDLSKTLEDENAKRIDETPEPDEESGNLNAKITPEVEKAPEKGKKEFTIVIIDGLEAFPLSEYEELDESLQFLKDCYFPLALYNWLLEEYNGDTLAINRELFGAVDFTREYFDRVIANGDTLTRNHGTSAYNFTVTCFLYDQVSPAVFDYYYADYAN